MVSRLCYAVSLGLSGTFPRLARGVRGATVDGLQFESKSGAI